MVAMVNIGLEVATGIALCFVTGMQGFGVTLIGTGAGSMKNGYINESNGGSFDAGWWGGQVSGLVSAIPGIVVGGGVIILSIGFEHLIRAISGYWD